MENKKADRKMVLEAFIKHETLTIDDLEKNENIGIVPNSVHLNFLLEELLDSGHLDYLPGVTPKTITITKKGIDEGIRLRKNPDNLRIVR